MQKKQDDDRLEPTPEQKAANDAEMISRLMENDPAAEEAVEKKTGRKKGLGRLRKLLEHGPREVVIAAGTHTDQKTGKTVTHEIKVTQPATGPAPDPATSLDGKLHTKQYTIREGNEEKAIPELKLNRTFGPYYTNRRTRRAFAQTIIREMARKARKKDRRRKVA